MKRSILQFFLVLALVFFGSTASAQIITSPNLICILTDEASGDVTIVWESLPLNPCGPFVNFEVFGRRTDVPGSMFSLIGGGPITDPNQIELNHIGANATVAEWEYFIVVNYNCPGFTSDPSPTLSEIVFERPVISLVTVLADGSIQVNWSPSPSPQTAGYIIYQEVPGGLVVPVDTVFGIGSTSTILPASLAQSSFVTLNIEAFAICDPNSGWISTVIDRDAFYNTIFISVAANSCAGTIDINLNNYINWPDTPDYELEVDIDKSGAFIAKTFNDFLDNALPPGTNTSFEYDVSTLTGDTVCVRFKAINPITGEESFSNQVCLPLNAVSSIGFNAWRTATVDTADFVSLEWYLDNSANLSRVVVQRSTNGTDFSPIDTIPLASVINLNDLEDLTAMPQQFSYYYRVIANDSCGSNSSSGVARTILLIGEEVDGINELSWNEFIMPNAVVNSYTVYRQEGFNRVALATLPSTDRTYSDPISAEVSDDGRFCYFVEAEYRLTLSNNGSISDDLTSLSNQLCIELPPVVYIPNAFVPSGVNQFFKPVLLFRELRNYDFRIFDRWGKELFATTNQIAGWDGTNNGEAMPMGGYTYLLRLETLTGDRLEERGVVFLVR